MLTGRSLPHPSQPPHPHCKKIHFEPANDKPCALLKQKKVFMFHIFVVSFRYVLPFLWAFLDSAAAKSSKPPGLLL